MAALQSRNRRTKPNWKGRANPYAFCLRFHFPLRRGTRPRKKDGFKAIQRILEQQKPEAAYFIAEGGKRTGILIMNMEDP